MLSSHTYWNLDGFQNPDTPLALNHSLHLPYAGLRTAIDNIEIPTGDLLANKQYDINDWWSSPKQLGANLTSPSLLGNCGFNCTGYDVSIATLRALARRLSTDPPAPLSQNCYILNRDSAAAQNWQAAPVATLASPWSGIQLDVYTDQAAFQLYTCNNMNGDSPFFQQKSFDLSTEQGFLPGTLALKESQGLFNVSDRPRVTEKYGCVVMEVEDWIDGVNHPEWGRNERQILGPTNEPFVLEATYKFSVNETFAGAYRR